MRKGDAYHKFSGSVLEVWTNYVAGNIAVNCDIVAEAIARGIKTIQARNNTSGFEFEGSVDELLARAVTREGKDGDFYLLTKEEEVEIPG